MFLYHASRSLIRKFHINQQGLHFGSINSSLEAALRHSDGDKIYLHKVLLSEKTFEKVYDCLDVGYDWESIIEEADQFDYTCIRYLNKYEPSISKSYCIWDEGLVECIAEIKVLSEDDAEKIIEEGEVL